MIDILSILPKPVPKIRVLDVGAMMGGVDPYGSLTGFSFLMFHSMYGRALVPLVRDHPANRISQMMCGDAVYGRDVMSLEKLSAEQLLAER